MGDCAADREVVEVFDNREAAEGRTGDDLIGAARVEIFSLVSRAGAGVGGRILMPGASEEVSVRWLPSVVVLPSSSVILELDGVTTCSSLIAANDASETEGFSATVRGG